MGVEIDKTVQYHIGLKEGDVGRYVLLPGDPGRVSKIASYFDKAKKVAENREFVTYTGEVSGIKISATSTGIGCPSAAIAIEELIKVGADTFIRVGTAGSLQREVKVGDVVIACGTVRQDGTSIQYLPAIYPAIPHPDVMFALKKAADKLNIRAHLGITHTKDAFYTEGNKDLPMAEIVEQEWKIWERANVLATSMEESALFIIGSIKKVRVGSVLAIIGSTWSDSPIEKKVGIDEAIKVAIEAVKILDAGFKI
jgi:uridine phosphorylase